MQFSSRQNDVSLRMNRGTCKRGHHPTPQCLTVMDELRKIESRGLSCGVLMRRVWKQRGGEWWYTCQRVCGGARPAAQTPRQRGLAADCEHTFIWRWLWAKRVQMRRNGGRWEMIVLRTISAVWRYFTNVTLQPGNIFLIYWSAFMSDGSLFQVCGCISRIHLVKIPQNVWKEHDWMNSGAEGETRRVSAPQIQPVLKPKHLS